MPCCFGSLLSLLFISNLTIYIDESGFRKNISRPYGYAPRGQKCVGVSGWGKAQTNVIGALCGTVPFAFTAFDCSIDSDVFHTWVTKILLPELPACSVIVMDNASFHKRQDTLDALQAEGHTVLWLPPYIAKMFIFSYRRMIMAYSPDFRKKVLETLSRGLSVRTTAAL